MQDLCLDKVTLTVMGVHKKLKLLQPKLMYCKKNPPLGDDPASDHSLLTINTDKS